MKPSGMCPTKRRLGDELAESARSYYEAVARLTRHEADDGESEQARAAVREAQHRADAARIAYEEHLHSHAC